MLVALDLDFQHYLDYDGEPYRTKSLLLFDLTCFLTNEYRAGHHEVLEITSMVMDSRD